MTTHGADSIYTFAPRLALAMDQRRAEMATARHRLRLARRRLARLEWLVEHRDLQLIRAGATGDGRYVKRRSDKLARAATDLARVQQEITRLEALAV